MFTRGEQNCRVSLRRGCSSARPAAASVAASFLWAPHRQALFWEQGMEGVRWPKELVWAWHPGSVSRGTRMIGSFLPPSVGRSQSPLSIRANRHTHIESQNREGWKRPLRSSSPTINPTPPCVLNQVLKCHIYTFFGHLQGWGLHHCPGQPGPMPDHSFSMEIFPNVQSNPPLMQLEASLVQRTWCSWYTTWQMF